MATMRKSEAVWSGGLKDGQGAISTESGALEAEIAGVEDGALQKLANEAWAGCPASKALNPPITLDARPI